MILRQKIKKLEPPLRTQASIKVESGGVGRQTYNAATNEFYPDRAVHDGVSLSPLVLIPIVGFTATDGSQSSENAAAQLINGKWERYDASGRKELPGGDPLIYEIVVTPGSADYGKLTIRENVSPGNPVTYVFTATLVVGGTSKVVTASYQAFCDGIVINPTLYFDNAKQGFYNPWSDGDTFTITPMVAPKCYPATFRWETMHGGVWTPLGSTPLDWAVGVDATTGKLTIDRSRMQGLISLKCIAEVIVDGVTQTLTEVVTHRRKLNFDIRGGGIENIAGLQPDTTTISPKAALDIPLPPSAQTAAKIQSELDIRWYGSGTTQIASGLNPSIPLSAVGADMDLGLSVDDRGGWKAVTDATGKVLTTADGKILLTR